MNVCLCLVAVNCDIHHAEWLFAPWLHQSLLSYVNILLHGSTSSTCLLVTLCVCGMTVHNILRSFWRNNNVFGHPAIEHCGFKWLLNHDDLNYLESILCAEPGLFLDEVQEKLQIVWDIKVLITTISHTLNHLAITHKHIAKEVAERIQHLHATWHFTIQSLSACPCLYCLYLDIYLWH